MDLYKCVGKSTGEFKLMRPVYCPSVLLRLEGIKGQVSKHTFLGFFVCRMVGTFR